MTNRIVIPTEKDAQDIWAWSSRYLKAKGVPNPFPVVFDSGVVDLSSFAHILLRFSKQSNSTFLIRVYDTKVQRYWGQVTYDITTASSTKHQIDAKIADPEALPKLAEFFDYMEGIWACVMITAACYQPVFERNARIIGEKAETKKSGKKSKNKKAKTLYSKTYVMNGTFMEEIKKEPRQYTKPDHEFGVKGHFRHYKSGKVSWVAPHVRCKGRGQATDQIYIAKIAPDNPCVMIESEENVS